jgi:hypothetical protein
VRFRYRRRIEGIKPRAASARIRKNKGYHKRVRGIYIDSISKSGFELVRFRSRRRIEGNKAQELVTRLLISSSGRLRLLEPSPTTPARGCVSILFLSYLCALFYCFFIFIKDKKEKRRDMGGGRKKEIGK